MVNDGFCAVEAISKRVSSQSKNNEKVPFIERAVLRSR